MHWLDAWLRHFGRCCGHVQTGFSKYLVIGWVILDAAAGTSVLASPIYFNRLVAWPSFLSNRQTLVPTGVSLVVGNVILDRAAGSLGRCAGANACLIDSILIHVLQGLRS